MGAARLSCLLFLRLALFSFPLHRTVPAYFNLLSLAY